MGDNHLTDVLLDQPRPLRFVTYNAAGAVVRSHTVTGDEMMAPNQVAHHALHADRVTRVQVFDLVTSDLLIDRSDPDPDGEG